MMNVSDLLDSMRVAECRTIFSECIVSRLPLLRDVTNPGVARFSGAELLLLNFSDVDKSQINGLHGSIRRSAWTPSYFTKNGGVSSAVK